MTRNQAVHPIFAQMLETFSPHVQADGLDESEDEGDYCPGCNPEPTINELECGKCASCGKEL